MRDRIWILYANEDNRILTVEGLGAVGRGTLEFSSPDTFLSHARKREATYRRSR